MAGRFDSGCHRGCYCSYEPSTFTAISREGSLLFWSLVLPLSPRTQLSGQTNLSLSLQCLGCRRLGSSGLFLLSFIRLPSWLEQLGLLAAWPLAEVGLMIDLTWPAPNGPTSESHERQL